MSVTRDILRGWRAPRRVMRARLQQGPREDRALILLITACLLIFVAQAPWQARLAHLDLSVPLAARLYWSGLFWLLIAPLLFYALGALSHVLALMFGGRGGFFGARLALFWTLLMISPLMLFQGLVAGFIGTGATATVTGLVVLTAFLFFWAANLYEAEQMPPASSPGMTT